MTEVKERPPAITDAGYDDDFSLWIDRQVDLLRTGRYAELDLPHLIEEIEDTGKEKRRALISSYRLVIFYLLKWAYQPTHRSRSWALTLVRERTNIDYLEEENPSLAVKAIDFMPKVYVQARREAHIETGLPLKIFPADCPFTIDELRDGEFMPEGPDGSGGLTWPM